METNCTENQCPQWTAALEEEEEEEGGEKEVIV
jgi:hypothetical protein